MTRRILSLGFISLLAPSIHAATIVTAGSDIDVAQTQDPTGFANNTAASRAIGDYWRTTSVAKPNDIDGDNVLGTDGYRYVRDGGGTDIQSSEPDYAIYSTLTTSQFDGNGGYAAIDNGTLIPGTTVANQVSGTFNPAPATAGEGTFVSFGKIEFSRDAFAGETVRIGLMVDNVDNTNFNSGTLRLTDIASGVTTDATAFSGTGTNGGNAGTGTFRGNRNPDWYYFDVTNFEDGQEIEFFATSSFGNGSTSTPATIAAFSFDSVPEPSSAVLIGLGAALGLMRRRR